MPRLLAAASAKQAAEALRTLDALLSDLPQPTPFRGLVQFYRGMALSAQKKPNEANEALAESIRLLPEYSAPLLVASQLRAYQDNPADAVDLLLRASRIDPPIVNRLDDYEIWNLLRRLDETHDTRRRMALSERLLETGWDRGRVGTVSAMAMFVLEQRLTRRDIAGAAKMVPKIVSPSLFARLLTEKKFEPLRPAAETWAGPQLEKQWPIYLRETRSEWEASKDPEAGRIYAAALSEAGHYRTLISTFSPSFEEKINRREEEYIFIVPRLAFALARLGRWDEADGLFARTLRIWSPKASANGLNLSANRARMAFFKGDFEASVEQMDGALEDSKKWGSQVSTGALASMHLYRACALEQLGRGADDVTSEGAVTFRRQADPASFVYFHLCGNNLAEAKKGLLEGLEHEDSRSAVLAWMQPVSDEEILDSEIAKTLAKRSDQLKADKQLIAAVRRHGRILDRPINSTAPAEQPVVND